MNHLVDWIRRHQIIAFFAITFAITWGLGFSYSAVLNKGMVFLFPVVAVATCGPGLAGIIVTAITNTQPKQGTKRASWIPALVLFPALFLLSTIISTSLGRQAVAVNQVPQTGPTGWVVIGLISLKFFYQLLFFNAVGEETGWRGFALPRMQ